MDKAPGETDKIKIREEVLAAVENHRIDLSRIDDKENIAVHSRIQRDILQNV